MSLMSNLFKSIKQFVSELNNIYGDDNRPLKLYSYLLDRTELKNRKAVKKHIKVFRIFCDKNKKEILDKSSTLVYSKIIYSDKVYIDVQSILDSADADTKKAIWEHLLCICAKLSPNSEAKNILRESFKSKTPENDFLKNIMGEVQSQISPGASSNPMQMIGNLLQSNTIGKLVSGMNDGVSSGKLDMKKLLGSVQGMISNLSEKLPDSNEMKKMKSLNQGGLENMMKTITQPDGLENMMKTITKPGGIENMMKQLEKPSEVSESKDESNDESNDESKDESKNESGENNLSESKMNETEQEQVESIMILDESPPSNEGIENIE
jgi:hypothetical protein